MQGRRSYLNRLKAQRVSDRTYYREKAKFGQTNPKIIEFDANRIRALIELEYTLERIAYMYRCSVSALSAFMKKHRIEPAYMKGVRCGEHPMLMPFEGGLLEDDDSFDEPLDF